MNEQEAKFRLRAYRPDGRDALDPTFAEALAQAEKDPSLRAWLEHERRLDASIAAKLDEVRPPAGLKDAILAGGRVSQPRRRWWTRTVWLAAAASIALLVSFTVRFRSSSRSAPTAEALATFAIDDLAHHHPEHAGQPGMLADVQAEFAHISRPLPGHLDLNLADLQRKGCRSIRLAGREVWEICFQREGHWYHLYAARAEDFAPDATGPHTLMKVEGTLAATAWKDSKHIYAIVGSPEAVKLLL